MIRAGEKVASGFKRGKRIGAGACLSIPRKRVPLLTLKKLVLQVMGNSLRNLLRMVFVLPLKAVINGAILCAEDRTGRVEPFLGKEAEC